MGSGNNYRLIIEGELSTEKIEAKIKSLNKKVVLDFGLEDKSIGKLQEKINKIIEAGGKLSKIKLFEDDSGKVSKAVIDYTNALGQAEQRTEEINKNVKETHTRVVDLNKVEQEGLKILLEKQKLTAKQADEMHRAELAADKFLAKAKNMSQSNNVSAAISKAQEIKIAVSEGDVAKVRKLNDEFAVLKSSLQTGRTGLDSWTAGLKNAVKQTAEYALSVGLIYGALSQLKNGIQYITELNKEMTNIRLVTGMNQEEINNLALGYNQLAKDVGATTLQVAQSSTEWYRQGKTIEETNQLIKSSMMLSKLGNVEAAQSTEYLTSIINGFKLEAQEVEDVISKLVALDNAFATSTAEIASAMQRSSVSAQQAGVSLDELASMITVVSDVSRKAPESIGESFKTMFARYQDILAGQVDEEGQGINNVGKALERVGINIRDATGGFRDFADVLDDLYGKWQDIDEVEQANILKAMAGTRQRETLLVLLENETKYRKALLEVQNSQGLAEERYAIYLESVEAAQNRLTASWEKMWQSTISSGMITWWIDFGTAVLNGIDALGGLKAIIISVATAFVIMNIQSIIGGFTMLWATVLQGISALKALAVGAQVAGASMNAAFGLVGVVAGAAVLAIFAIANSIETVQEKLDRLNEEIITSNETIKKLRDNVASVERLSEEFETLSEKEKLTKEETQRLVDVQNQLKDILPELNGHFDEYGNFIIEDANQMKELTQATLDQIEAQKQLRQAQIDEKADVQAESLLKANERKQMADRGAVFTGTTKREISEQEKIKINIDWEETLSESKSAFSEMSQDAKLAFIEALRDGTKQGNELAEIFAEEFRTSMDEEEITPFGSYEKKDEIVSQASEIGEETAESLFESFTATLDGLISDDEGLNKLIEKAFSTEGLDFSDIHEIPEQYLDALTVENGKLQLNVDLIRERQIVEAEMSLQTIQEAYARGEATAQEVAIIQLYYDQLREKQYQTIGDMQVTEQTAAQVFMAIAQNASASGNSFIDLQGKALTSADSIYKFLMSGDQAFNAFVQQAANITGQSVANIMAQINSMISQTYANTVSMMNLGSSLGTPYSIPSSSQPKVTTTAPVSNIFAPAPVSVGGGGGGSSGGSGTPKKTKAQKKAEQQKKIQDQISKAQKEAEESLKKQLDAYKDILDIRKEILDTMQEERDYQDNIEEKNEEILKLQNELATLQLDNSAESQARQLEIQDELSKAQKELEDMEYEHSIEVQKAALDAEYDAFEKSVNDAIDAIKGINATSLSDFSTKLADILAGISQVPTFHSGAEKGVVGGSSSTSLKSGELFAKLMKGEVVTNGEQIDNFMNKTLPQLASGSSSYANGDISVSMPISVAGNLDKSVIPDLDKIANRVLDKINEAMGSRGWNRRADLFSTG